MRFRKQLVGDLILLAPVTIWAVNFTVVREAMQQWGEVPFTFLAFRFSVATIAFLPFLFFMHSRRTVVDWKAHLRPGCIVAISLVFAYGLQTNALVTSGAGQVAFITSLSVVLVPLAMYLLYRQAVDRVTWGGVLLATVGLALLTVHPRSGLHTGDLLAIAGAVALTVDVIIVAQYAPRLNLLAFTSIQVLVLAVITAVLALFLDAPRGVPPMTGTLWFAVLFTGIAATAVAFFLQAWGQRHTSATHAALVFCLEPVIALLVGYAWSSEAITLRAALGGILIVLGTVLAEVVPAARTTEQISEVRAP